MKKLLILVPVLLLLLLDPVAIVVGESKDETKISTLPAGEVVNKDYFATGDVVEVSGTVNGDVYAFGGQVLVDGKVNGDLITAGGTVTISGDISQDLRAGGGQITISGQIGRNVTIGGGSVEFTDDADVRGSVLAGAGNITLAAPVGSNIKIGAGNLTISNKVNGDVEAGVGSLRLTSKAQIKGDITYWSDRNASIDENAFVSGKVVKKAAPVAPKPPIREIFGGFAAFNIFTALVGFVSTFILGLILIKITPNFTKTATSTLGTKIWASLGIGLLALILTPIVFIILLVTVVGFPLGLMLIPVYLISIYVARIFVIYWVGNMIFDRTGRKLHEVWALVLGLVIYYILTLVPVVGSIVTFLTIVFGIGAALIAKREMYLAARSKNII